MVCSVNKFGNTGAATMLGGQDITTADPFATAAAAPSFDAGLGMGAGSDQFGYAAAPQQAAYGDPFASAYPGAATQTASQAAPQQIDLAALLGGAQGQGPNPFAQAAPATQGYDPTQQGFDPNQQSSYALGA